MAFLSLSTLVLQPASLPLTWPGLALFALCAPPAVLTTPLPPTQQKEQYILGDDKRTSWYFQKLLATETSILPRYSGDRSTWPNAVQMRADRAALADIWLTYRASVEERSGVQPVPPLDHPDEMLRPWSSVLADLSRSPNVPDASAAPLTPEEAAEEDRISQALAELGMDAALDEANRERTRLLEHASMEPLGSLDKARAALEADMPLRRQLRARNRAMGGASSSGSGSGSGADNDDNDLADDAELAVFDASHGLPKTHKQRTKQLHRLAGSVHKVDPDLAGALERASSAAFAAGKTTGGIATRERNEELKWFGLVHPSYMRARRVDEEMRIMLDHGDLANETTVRRMVRKIAFNRRRAYRVMAEDTGATPQLMPDPVHRASSVVWQDHTRWPADDLQARAALYERLFWYSWTGLRGPLTMPASELAAISFHNPDYLELKSERKAGAQSEVYYYSMLAREALRKTESEEPLRVSLQPGEEVWNEDLAALARRRDEGWEAARALLGSTQGVLSPGAAAELVAHLGPEEDFHRELLSRVMLRRQPTHVDVYAAITEARNLEIQRLGAQTQQNRADLLDEAVRRLDEAKYSQGMLQSEPEVYLRHRLGYMLEAARDMVRAASQGVADQAESSSGVDSLLAPWEQPGKPPG